MKARYLSGLICGLVLAANAQAARRAPKIRGCVVRALDWLSG